MRHRLQTTIPFRKLCPLLGLLGGLALGPAPLRARNSVSSAASADVLQTGNDNLITGEGQISPTGSLASGAYGGSYTGMDGSGNTRTMTFSGTASASAQYGQLHAAASATVANTYYNPANPAYLYVDHNTGMQAINPAGSPTGFQSNGLAMFTDTLQYGGALQAGYQARYIFHLDGAVSGTNAAPYLNVTIAGQTQSFTTTQTGNLSLDWATMDVPVTGQTAQQIAVSFNTEFSLDLSDGKTPDGSNVSGMAQFSDTLTLTAIEVVDAKATRCRVSRSTRTPARRIRWKCRSLPPACCLDWAVAC